MICQRGDMSCRVGYYDSCCRIFVLTHQCQLDQRSHCLNQSALVGLQWPGEVPVTRVRGRINKWASKREGTEQLRIRDNGSSGVGTMDMLLDRSHTLSLSTILPSPFALQLIFHIRGSFGKEAQICEREERGASLTNPYFFICIHL